MPMERSRYPKDWPKIAAAVKEQAGWKCEGCGKQCRRPGEPFDTHRRTLTVAHLNHKPEDCRPENLKALCAPCHLRYDAQHHAETRKRKQVRYNCPHFAEPQKVACDSTTCTNDSENPNTSPDHIAEAGKMEPFARGRENGKDIIYRQDAIDALADAGIVNYAATGDGNGMLQAVNVIKALTSAQPELIEKAAYIRGFEQGRTQGIIDTKAEKVAQLPRMTDDDIQTIRIELSAVYESLCNQRRYREAKEYDGLIARFLTFAQARPEPVKWLKDEFGSRCGACGSYAYLDKFGRPWESDYCPCCGARMEKPNE